MSRMQTRSFQMRFLTPAFLGNANQSGQWRTPPIKALLRQWWRVAVAQQMQFDVVQLRKAEQDLFGVAADGGDSHQSQIRLRLSHWDEGKLKSWASIAKVRHPEVKNRDGAITPVGSDLYLGYGPLGFQNKNTALKANAAIQAGESATLRLAVPDEHADAIRTALALMNLYGTLGGRSRNGWGSFSLTPADEHTPALPQELADTLKLPLSQTLERDWPHAIGSDGRALVWQTQAFDDWKKLMQKLAEIKIELRTQFTFTTGKDSPRTEDRHWLSYPITNHSVKAWGGNARLPNSLRFKVRLAPNDPKRVVGIIVHIPCLPPPSFNPDPNTIQRVWQQVHTFLDAAQNLTRIPA